MNKVDYKQQSDKFLIQRIKVITTMQKPHPPIKLLCLQAKSQNQVSKQPKSQAQKQKPFKKEASVIQQQSKQKSQAYPSIPLTTQTQLEPQSCLCQCKGRQKNTLDQQSIPLPSTPSIQAQFQLQNQAVQMKKTIQRLHQQNKKLNEKVAFYEIKINDFNLINEELEFRREQQRFMEENIENYQRIVGRLRNRIKDLEGDLDKDKDRNKLYSQSTYQQSDFFDQTQSQSQCESQSRSRNIYLQDSKFESGRRSLGESQKQNHPLTPKTRVSINLDNLIKNQMDSMHHLKIKKKVFI